MVSKMFRAKGIFLWFKAGEEVSPSEEHLQLWLKQGLVEEVGKVEIKKVEPTFDPCDINHDGKIDNKDLNLLSSKIKSIKKK